MEMIKEEVPILDIFVPHEAGFIDTLKHSHAIPRKLGQMAVGEIILQFFARHLCFFGGIGAIGELYSFRPR